MNLSVSKYSIHLTPSPAGGEAHAAFSSYFWLGGQVSLQGLGDAGNEDGVGGSSVHVATTEGPLGVVALATVSRALSMCATIIRGYSHITARHLSILNKNDH
jgi:hypothetical protein